MSRKLIALSMFAVLLLSLGVGASAEGYVASSVGKGQVVTIDGDLSDWQAGGKISATAIQFGDKAQAVRGGGAWTGPEDSSGQVYFKWTKDYLLVAGDVTDDVGILGGRPDNGDSIGVTIIVDGTDNLLTEMTPYPPEGKWSDGVLFRQGGLWIAFSSNTVVRAAKKADDKGYYLEAAIPWADLKLMDKQVKPATGEPVLFNVLLTDSDDGASRKSALLNTRSESNPVSSWYSDQAQFMPMTFDGDGAGTVKW